MRSRFVELSVVHRLVVSVVVVGALLASLGSPAAASRASAEGPLAAAIEVYAAEAAGSEFSSLAARVQSLDRNHDLLTEALMRAHALGIPAGDLTPLLDQVLRLSEDQMPSRPVLSRYLQGLSKGVPIPRIRAAAESLELRLRKAGEYLGRSYEGFAGLSQEERFGLIDHVAYALEVGVLPATVERSLALMGRETDRLGDAAGVRSPILALSFLAYAGVDDERSFELVSTAWDQGYRGANLERLGETVVKLGSSHGNPELVVNRVLDMLGAELSPDRVFQDLDALGSEPAGGTISPNVPVDDPSRGQGRFRPEDGSSGSNNSKLGVVDGSQGRGGD